MINFRVLSGGNKHICELQVVHTSMLNARKGLPGHLYYGIVRNAMEMMGYCPEGEKKMYSTDMAALLPFLPDDMNQVEHRGWLQEDVPLGDWSYVTTNAQQQVVEFNAALVDNRLLDATIRDLAQGLPNLTSINLARCGNITNVALQYLAEGCPNLTNIDLGWCPNITDAGVEHLTRGCPKIKIVK